MRDYQQHSLVPITYFLELAKKAKVQNERWIKNSLSILAVTSEPGLANALLMHLRLKAVAEELDPFPFDTPAEEEFV